MRVIGIDPGITITGYGVIEQNQQQLKLVTSGVIATSSAEDFSRRLMKIHQELTEVITKQAPQAMAIEDVFLADNVKTTLKLGQARGVAVLAAAEAGVPVFAYSVSQVKEAVVGYGNADKHQVAAMVVRIIGTPPLPTVDETDALAAAICHLHSSRLKGLLTKINRVSGALKK